MGLHRMLRRDRVSARSHEAFLFGAKLKQKTVIRKPLYILNILYTVQYTTYTIQKHTMRQYYSSSALHALFGRGILPYMQQNISSHVRPAVLSA
jgi:hypothetical protein